MTAAQRIIVNTTVQYTRTIINVGLSLYSTRLILAALGQNDFGLYSIVAGVVAMLSFMINALVSTTQRYLSYYHGKGDKEQLRSVFGNSILLHVLICIGIIVILGALTQPVIYSMLKIEAGRETAALAVYVTAVGMLALSFLTAPFRALFIARENIVYISIIDVLDGVFKLLIAIYLAYATYDKLITYSVLLTLISVFNLVAFAVYALWKFEECYIPRWRDWNSSFIKELSSFAGWTTYSTGCILARTQGIAVLLNRFFSSAINAAYGIALQVNGATAFIAQSIANSMSPQIIKAAGQSDQQKVLVLSEKASKYAVTLFSLVAIPLIAEMDIVLDVWLGAPPPFTAMFCRFILISCILDQMTMGLTLANQATGKIKYYSLIINTTKLLTLPVAWICLRMGMECESVMWCYLAFEFLCAIIRLPYIKIAQGLSIRHYVKTVICRVIIPIGVSSIFCWWLVNYTDIHYRILLTITGSTLIFALCSYGIVLDNDERQTLKHILVKK